MRNTCSLAMFRSCIRLCQRMLQAIVGVPARPGGVVLGLVLGAERNRLLPAPVVTVLTALAWYRRHGSLLSVPCRGPTSGARAQEGRSLGRPRRRSGCSVSPGGGSRSSAA